MIAAKSKMSHIANLCNVANICNDCYIGYMDLNIRDFPDELAKKLRIYAVANNETLRELVIRELEKAMTWNETQNENAKWVTERIGAHLSAERAKQPKSSSDASSGKSARKRATPDKVVEDVKDLEDKAVPVRNVAHSENCRCFICKPPK